MEGEGAQPQAAVQRLGAVLVVDDEALMLRALARSFAPFADKVATASDGPSALAAARAVRPQLIVLDLMLGEQSGLELYAPTRRTRASSC